MGFELNNVAALLVAVLFALGLFKVSGQEYKSTPAALFHS